MAECNGGGQDQGTRRMLVNRRGYLAQHSVDDGDESVGALEAHHRGPGPMGSPFWRQLSPECSRPKLRWGSQQKYYPGRAEGSRNRTLHIVELLYVTLAWLQAVSRFFHAQTPLCYVISRVLA